MRLALAGLKGQIYIAAIVSYQKMGLIWIKALPLVDLYPIFILAFQGSEQASEH